MIDRRNWLIWWQNSHGYSHLTFVAIFNLVALEENPPRCGVTVQQDIREIFNFYVIILFLLRAFPEMSAIGWYYAFSSECQMYGCLLAARHQCYFQCLMSCPKSPWHPPTRPQPLTNYPYPWSPPPFSHSPSWQQLMFISSSCPLPSDLTRYAQSVPSSKPVSTTFYLISQTFSNCPCRWAPFAPTSKWRSNTYPENAYSGQ